MCFFIFTCTLIMRTHSVLLWSRRQTRSFVTVSAKQASRSSKHHSSRPPRLSPQPRRTYAPHSPPSRWHAPRLGALPEIPNQGQVSRTIPKARSPPHESSALLQDHRSAGQTASRDPAQYFRFPHGSNYAVYLRETVASYGPTEGQAHERRVHQGTPIRQRLGV